MATNKNDMNEQLTQIADGWMQKSAPTINDLSESVIQTHQSAQYSAIKAVNQMATLRNWLIGCYIVEYEQKGSDRAKYGDKLLKCLEERVNVKGLNETLFRVARRFYTIYPRVGELFVNQKSPTASDKFSDSQIHATPSHEFKEMSICATALHEFMTPITILISKLSFSHIREIMTQDDPLARFFYETECIKGTWSVKELRRQIATNLYFRSGVSKDPKKLLASIEPEKNTAALTIRQPFAFEFLRLNAKDVVTESDLEDALAGMDNNLFVSTYMLQLPDKSTLEKFLRDEIHDLQE